MKLELKADEIDFEDFYPFYMCIDRNLLITDIGRSLLKIFPNCLGSNIFDFFTFKRPWSIQPVFEDFEEYSSNLFILEEKVSKIRLRYQIRCLNISNKILFVGGPWFTSSDELVKHQLSVSDYALSDSFTEVIQVIQSLEINNKEIHQLVSNLEQQRNLLKQVLDLVPHQIFLKDKEGKLLMGNQAMIDAVGKKDFDEIFGKYDHQLWPEMHQTLEYRLDDLKVIRERVKIEKPAELQTNFSGDAKINHVIKLPFYFSHSEIGVLGIAIDITESLNARLAIESSASRMESLISSINASILLEDENRKIVLVNQMFCDLFQIPMDPKSMVGLDCSNAASQSKWLFKYPDAFEASIETILQNKKAVLNELLEMQNGTIVERDFIPILVNGDYHGHLWLYRDISERKKQESELIEAKRKAEELSKTKEMFLSTMSHEIRTPLNAVIGFTQLLMGNQKVEMDPQVEKEYLTAIKHSADNLLALINDILDFSKIESGKVVFESVNFHLKDTLNRIKNIFSQQLNDKNLGFEVFIRNEVPELLKGDVTRLNQILTNLVSNAIKFTETGTIKIEVSKKANEGFVFQVSDTGIGIAESKIDRIFESFTQANSDTTRKYGGTGLGLTITKLLVELQGGSISVQSKPQQGTTFSFWLPFQIGTPEINANKSYAGDNNSFVGTLSVLLVEDNRLNQIVASEFLKRWNAEVTLAENGKIALQILEKKSFDLILMDIQMPEMDGFEATRQIRALYGPDLKVLALTATTNDDIRKQILEAGMDDYIAKPFEAGALYAKIETLTRKNLAEKKHNPDLTKINFKHLQQLFGQNKAIVNEMLQCFADDTPPMIVQLSEAANRASWKEVAAMAHKLKSSLAYMGFETTRAVELEQNAKNENEVGCELLKDQVQQLVHQLEQAVLATQYHLGENA